MYCSGTVLSLATSDLALFACLAGTAFFLRFITADECFVQGVTLPAGLRVLPTGNLGISQEIEP